MEKFIQYIGLVVKAVIFMALLAIFCVLCLPTVMRLYSEKFSIIAKLSKTADKVEVPTISICTGWKTSIMDEYKITSGFLWTPSSNESNLQTDATIRNVYSDVTYKLNKDFAIGLFEGAPKEPKSLKVGMNEIVTGKILTKYDVKEISTPTYGMCYIIIPSEIFMTPYVDYLTVLVAKNSTLNKDKIDEVMVQISSNDTFPTIMDSAPAIDNEVISMEFDLQNKDKLLFIDYSEENTEYISDCSEMAFFKCWATKIQESEEFKCPKKCVALAYQSMMDTIDHNLSTCETDTEQYCMVGPEGLETIMKLKSNCQKQCKNKGSKLVIRKSEYAYPHQLGSIQIAVELRILPEIVYFKEYLIFDELGMLVSIGGSLGLFLGFSLFDTLCLIVDFILRKVSNQVTKRKETPSTVISLIKVKSRLPILKNSTLHTKKSPLQIY